jgi:hypothetical protein
MWPHVSWQDITNALNAVGALIVLVGGAIDVARKARDRHDRKPHDEDQR